MGSLRSDDEELRRLFFPGLPPRFIVGERVAFDLEAPGGRAAGAGCPRSEYDSNWHQFSIGRAAMSLFGRDNWRVGTPENTIEARDCGAGVVGLKFRVTSTAPPLAADPRAGEPELDIYADPGEPADPEVLEALHTLHAGLWPGELTEHAGGPWPARGSRPLARAVTPEHGHGHVGPADLLPHLTHPFDRRFLRLPMAPLLAAARAEQVVAERPFEIEVPVHVGRRFAPRVAGLLGRTEGARPAGSGSTTPSSSTGRSARSSPTRPPTATTTVPCCSPAAGPTRSCWSAPT